MLHPTTDSFFRHFGPLVVLMWFQSERKKCFLWLRSQLIEKLPIEDAKIVVLKTGSNFQYFEPWRKGLIRVDSPGATQSNLKDFTWRRLPRPIFPLDEMSAWKAEARVAE